VLAKAVERDLVRLTKSVWLTNFLVWATEALGTWPGRAVAHWDAPCRNDHVLPATLHSRWDCTSAAGTNHRRLAGMEAEESNSWVVRHHEEVLDIGRVSCRLRQTSTRDQACSWADICDCGDEAWCQSLARLRWYQTQN
jgi:hypothetical protein